MQRLFSSAFRIHRLALSFGGISRRVVVYDFGDSGEGDFDYLAVGALDLDARRGQCLSGFHAADDAAHAVTVRCYDLDVVFAVERAQGCEGFGDFHYLFTALSLLVVAKSLQVKLPEPSHSISLEHVLARMT
jgi:hypothetical protein